MIKKEHEVPILSVGSKVLLENTAQLQRKGGKMDPRWLGPYVVHGYLGKGVYELATPSGKILKKTANVSRLDSLHGESVEYESGWRS